MVIGSPEEIFGQVELPFELLSAGFSSVRGSRAV
jgi:hypothetical protein